VNGNVKITRRGVTLLCKDLEHIV